MEVFHALRIDEGRALGSAAASNKTASSRQRGAATGTKRGDECAECVSVVREVGGGPLVGEVLHLLQHQVDGLRGLVARHWAFTGHITAALERLALLPNPG